MSHSPPPSPFNLKRHAVQFHLLLFLTHKWALHASAKRLSLGFCSALVIFSEWLLLHTKSFQIKWWRSYFKHPCANHTVFFAPSSPLPRWFWLRTLGIGGAPATLMFTVCVQSRRKVHKIAQTQHLIQSQLSLLTLFQLRNHSFMNLFYSFIVL